MPRHVFIAAALVGALTHAIAQTSRAAIKGESLEPFAATVNHLVKAMDYLDHPFSAAEKLTLNTALDDVDRVKAIAGIQRVLDKRCLLEVHINPESRVKVAQGPAQALLVKGR